MSSKFGSPCLLEPALACPLSPPSFPTCGRLLLPLGSAACYRTENQYLGIQECRQGLPSPSGLGAKGTALTFQDASLNPAAHLAPGTGSAPVSGSPRELSSCHRRTEGRGTREMGFSCLFSSCRLFFLSPTPRTQSSLLLEPRT